MTPADLALVRSEPTPIPAAPREPMRTAAWVASNVFSGERSPRWVLKHCPRVQLTAGVVRFYESVVREWIATRYRDGAA
jgi:hypothetical protein